MTSSLGLDQSQPSPRSRDPSRPISARHEVEAKRLQPTESTTEKDAELNSRSHLIDEQHGDPEISPLFQKTVDENEMLENSVCFFAKNGVLMRKLRLPDVSADDERAVKYQLAVLKVYRTEFLSMAHETPLVGHMGVNNTQQRNLNQFYWPNLREDVADFCRSCHACSVVGKPNQVIPKVPLQPIPAIKEPFIHIIVDCVGPLPKPN